MEFLRNKHAHSTFVCFYLSVSFCMAQKRSRSLQQHPNLALACDAKRFRVGARLLLVAHLLRPPLLLPARATEYHQWLNVQIRIIYEMLIIFH